MSLTQAMWVHGTAMRVEFPDRTSSIFNAGFFTRVIGRPDTTNWFHFNIPTPVIVRDKRQMVDSVLLRFHAGSTQATVTNVHVFDGEGRIATHDGLRLSPSEMSLSRFNVAGKPDVLWGLGISVGVRFGSGSDAQRTLEFASAGCDFTLMQSVRVHFKVLTSPSVSLDTMLDSMRQVYEPSGFRVLRVSDETLNLPALDVVDVGTCTRGNVTAEQTTLFGNRNNVGTNDVVVYFVQATNPPFNGCAAHPNGRPGAVVASGATRWTLGHEVGHVLGLNHVDNNDRLMTGNGTANITNPPPDLVASETTTMQVSPLTIDA